jgi:hypothetical protein
MLEEEDLMISSIFLLLLIPALAQAQERPRASVTPPSCGFPLGVAAQPNDRYSFAHASVIALSYARSAVQEADAFQAERRGENWQTDLIGMMRHTKAASEAYACAQKMLEPYEASEDERIIRSAAEFENLVYKRHVTLNDEFLDLLRKLPGLSHRPTDFADSISTIEVERGKLWTDLTTATTLAVMGLVDQNKTDKDGLLHTLVITRKERQELLNRLQKSFPGLTDKTAESSRGMPTKIASLYYTFMNNPRYRCKDE